MALQQPTNIFPSSFAGTGGDTVDAEQGFPVSWQVNGSSALTAYQIQIFQNTAAAAVVYDSGKTTVSPAFFGRTSTGEIRFFEVNLSPSALSGLTNGQDYKLLITQWWQGGSVVQLSPSFFRTRTTPTLTLAPFDAPVRTRSAVFRAVYRQAQRDTLDWFRWMLAVQGEEQTPIADSGMIYGTEDIQVSYDGLFSGTTYVVRCLAQTAHGVQADTGWVKFAVSYPVSPLTGYIEACPSQTEGIAVRWPRVSYIPGKPSGSYTISDGILHLRPGASITWEEKNGNPLLLEHPWTLALSSRFPVHGTAPALTVNDALALDVLPDGITLSLNGTQLARLKMQHILKEHPIRIVLTPRELHASFVQITGALYPALELYPSDGLYPASGTQERVTQAYPLTWVQPEIRRLTLHGEQWCDWLTVIHGEVSGSRLSQLLSDLTYEPSWTLDTLFLATFQDGQTGGGNITPSEPVTGVAIYRKAADTARLTFIAHAPIGATMLLDEGFRNQVSYTYYVFVLGETTYVSPPLISDPVFPNFWNWTVLACAPQPDTDGVYHLETAHIFRNNVSTDALTNNNTPSVLQNFTPYPTRQPTSYNYRSSTLVGYIGTVDQTYNRYLDTPAQAEALWGLSVSAAPKFLRNRKGDLWRIETAAGITMQTGDTQAAQPYLGSVPWMETGSADGVSIVCAAGDGAWDDLVPPETPDDIPRIVVTVAAGASVTLTNGTETRRAISGGVVTHAPAAHGIWTVQAALDGRTVSKTISVTTDETYYVGLVFSEFSAHITVSAPSGTVVTIQNGVHRLTQEVP